MKKVYLSVLVSIIYVTSFGLVAMETNEMNSLNYISNTEESSEMEEDVTCGYISDVRIYDQATDQPVWEIDALYDGIQIDANLLPSNYYIAVETEGNIESVSIWVNGNSQSIENIMPFTYPNGAENGDNLNLSTGSYDLDAVAYLYDDAYNQCSSVWLAFDIVDGGCDNLTYAGWIEDCPDTCTGSEFTIQNGELPSGGSGDIEYVWLFNQWETNPNNATMIANSNSPSLTTSNDASGYYRRCARRVGCSDYSGESNWIYVTVNDCPCDNFTDGGSISNDFTACASDDFTLANIQEPTGGSGEVEIIWLFNANEADPSTSTIIENETGYSLTINNSESGWYRRCARRAGCDIYMGESNWVYITIDNNCNDCEVIAPTADNLNPEIDVECGDAFPEVTFSDETSSATVINYEEYSVAKSCEIDFSTYADYSNTNIWFHAFNTNYDKHFRWTEGHVITFDDNTVKVIGRIESVNDATSGFLIEFFFHELEDQSTFLANGGYESTDSYAADRMYANVDFSMPNSIVGFGDFADSDLALLDNDGVHHMDMGPREVYGGYGFGFWIEYGGTVNGQAVGNSATNGTNHLDMYSALNTCFENNNDCEDLIIREWTVQDECGNTDIFVQQVNVVDTEAPTTSGLADVTIVCDEEMPTNEPAFTDACDTELDIAFDESSSVNADGLTVLTRTWTATDDCGNSTSTTQTITILACTNVGDTVWYDNDRDGIQDADEMGVEGVTVNLISAGPDGLFHTDDDMVVATEVTDSNGNYLFEGVTPGDYCIEFVSSTIPADYSFTGQNEGANDANDSDANADGKTDSFTVVSGQDDDLNWDAGIFTCTDITIAEDLEDIIIECGNEIPEPIAPVFMDGANGEVTVVYSESDDSNDCESEITRTWVATNDCGNTLTVEQILTIVDTTPPTLEGVPGNTSFECLSDVPDAPMDIMASDNCDSNPEIVYNEEISSENDCESLITRTWTVSDDCENTTTYTQMISIMDETNPEAESVPANVTILCDEDMPTNEPAFTDNCDMDLDVAYSEEMITNAQGLQVTIRTWIATDDCNNSVTVSQEVTKAPCVNIGDTVWYDSNQDGIQDANETGVEGVTVNLISAGPDGLFHTDDDMIVATETTDENGNYLFEEVYPGTYCIEFVSSTIPADFVFTSTDAGNDDANDSDADENGKTEAFTVTADQEDDLTFDAGIYEPVNIGDFVWNDLNQDGIQDANEPGVEGVTVNLISAGPDGLFHTDDDFVVDTQITDENGNYLFEDVAPGVYCIEFVTSTLPTGTEFTSTDAGNDDANDSDANADGKTEPFTVEAGQEDDMTFDAGIFDPINIGDTVWNDLNQDGIQDANEPGVEGVTVNLISAGPDGLFHTDDDMIVATEVTDENGNYLFEGVEPGIYCIEFVTSTLPTGTEFTSTDAGNNDAADSDANAEGKTEPFTLTAGQDDDMTFDAGIIDPVNIGDTVWYDENQDGIQDANETGVEGVTVNLISAGPDGLFHTDDDMIVATETTDENGNYLFEGVVPGTYCIEFVSSTIPADFVFTSTDAGNDDANDSDADENGKTEAFTVEAGQEDDLTFDAGIYEPVNIGDFVWNDLNQDGIQDANEPGVEGVTVNLISAGPDGLFHTDDDFVVDTQVTDENGNYLFEDVAPGVYCIEFVTSTLPTGTEFTSTDAGSDDANDSDANADGKTEPFTVEAGQEDDMTFDAGIFDPINIGDTVWNDLNQDGIQDANEPGVEGVTVNLISAGPDGLFHTDDDMIVATEVTDENGNYLFEGVEPGIYCIEFVTSTLPIGTEFTSTDAGNNDANDSDANVDGKTEPFTLTAGQDDDMTFDAGIIDPVNIGDTVWNDLNRDGIQDANEPGVEGVTVNLISAGPDGLFHTDDDMIVATEVTDENGNYLFEGVVPGTYCIEFVSSTIPAEFEFTGTDAGTNDAADSDANAEGKTEPFEVVAGQEDNLTYDAGIYTCTDVTIEAPMLQDMTIECSDDMPAVVTPNFIDAVDDNLTVVFNEESTVDGCNTIITRTWVATNDCGNSIEFTQVITIMDTTDPVVVNAPANLNLECNDAIPTASVEFTDNCDNDLTVAMTESTSEEGCVTTITRTWTATDDCDNSSSVSQIITITDSTSPSVVSAPADVTIECGEDVASESPVFTDNCDTDLDVTMEETTSEDGCSMVMTRTWTAMDDCGNQTSVSQAITITDTTAPVASNVPADMTASCGEEVAIIAPSFTDNCDDEIAVVFNEETTGTGCDITITRTWTATDNCGNETTVAQVISQMDAEAPMLIIPSDVSIDCATADLDPSNTGNASALDNCTTASVTYVDGPVTGSCPVSIVRTWTAVDGCGNSVSLDQVITIIDEVAPTLTVPADVTIECSESPELSLTGYANAIDSCDDDVTVEFVDGPLTGACPYSFERTFTAVDFCGNVSTGVQVITISDTTAPILTSSPEDLTVDCGESIPSAMATFSDNCDDDVTVTMTEENVPMNCGYQIVRVFVATDACGNTADFTQTITVADVVAPILVGIPADIALECGETPANSNVTATDNCDANVTVTMTETQGGQGCEEAIVRTWTATDECGNSVSESQSISFNDTTAPVITCPDNVMVNCENSGSDPDVTGTATATDNCSGVSVTYSDGSLSGACPASFVRTWSAVDGCGNVATCEQVITIIDDNAPTLIVPADITLSCGESTEGSNTGNASAFDGCGGASVTYADVVSGDCPVVITRTFTAVDACGNTSSDSQIITIIDTTAPVVVNGPADMTIQCGGAVPPSDNIIFTDSCDDDVAIEMTEQTNALSCGFELVRTWTATDNCGNVGVYSQTISVTDDVAPVFANVPADETIACGGEPTAPGTVTATDNCSDDVTISFNEETSGSGCSLTITRTWTATDECGNVATATQLVSITDDVAPVLNGIPGDMTVDCANIPEPAVVTATDNCDDDVTVAFYEEADYSVCPYTITRHYTAIDACGNLTKDNQVITVTDNVAPSFGNYPTSITASCDVLDSYVLLATDACDNDVQMSYTDNGFSGGCLGVIERTWIAEDNCGNVATAIQFITLYDDQAPIVENAPADVTIDCGADVPVAANIVATDNCDSDLEIAFTEVQNGTDCPYTITRTWTIVDDCENETIVTQIISVLTGGIVADAEIVTSPNPFNESTKISFILPEDGFVLLEVYSSLGEKVDIIYKGYALGGMYYEFNIDTEGWNSGMYHTKLIFEGEISSTKMLKSN